MGDRNDLRDVNASDSTSQLLTSKFKFRDMKVHSSDEWMADATKKYRQVFDRYEASHIRVELSFYNKLFDEQDWDTSVRLKCFLLNGSARRELCDLVQERQITKTENVVYIRDSWGNATPGVYWVKGNYIWEAYIDNMKIGEAAFYIEDVGVPANEENLYFDIQHIKLFEGDGQAPSQADKTFLRKFSQKETRYVWGEFCFKNKSAGDYYAEIFFNFSDDAGQFKGRSTRLIYVQPNTAGQLYYVNPSWGSEFAGSWKDDVYTMEVVFMDNLIATVPFQVGENSEEGDVHVVTDTAQNTRAVAMKTSSANKSMDDLLFESLAELNALTGLDDIKQEVNEMVKLVKFYQESGKDVLNKFSLHTVFTGNPGTGKTTVARILSKIYKGLGILEKGHLVEVDRQTLVAGYVGQTAIKTAEKINEAMGGILFIDEAYSLSNEHGSSHDFGAESIQVILKRMEDFRGKFGVIVAGYTENMYEFINSNPGLRSRFDKYFMFEDYSAAEMFTIAGTLLLREGVALDTSASQHLRNYFDFLDKNRDIHFGNARTVRQVIGEVIKNQHLRLASMKKEERTRELMDTIIYDDVKEFEIRSSIPQQHRALGFQIGRKET